MGADYFLDEKIFNPERLIDYIFEFNINSMKIKLEDFKNLNK